MFKKNVYIKKKIRHFLSNLFKTKRLNRIKNDSNLNNDKKFYIIRRIASDSGFFSNYMYVLGHIIYADKKKMIPIVDMKNYKTLYNEDKKICGTLNAWEYYFKTNYTLEEALNSKYAYYSDFIYSEELPLYSGKNAWYPNKEETEKFHNLILEYIIVKDEIINDVNKIYLENSGGKKVLGIHIRGTDMKNYKDHPAPPSVEAFIEAASQMMDKHNIEKIFLCTDEIEIENIMRNKFKDILFTTDSFRAESNNTNGIHMTEGNRENHKYLLGREVLIDTLLLSKCNCLLSGHSNIPLVAQLMNGNKYEEQLII